MGPPFGLNPYISNVALRNSKLLFKCTRINIKAILMPSYKSLYGFTFFYTNADEFTRVLFTEWK